MLARTTFRIIIKYRGKVREFNAPIYTTNLTGACQHAPYET